jgi:hypothetical protein
MKRYKMFRVLSSGFRVENRRGPSGLVTLGTTAPTTTGLVRGVNLRIVKAALRMDKASQDNLRMNFLWVLAHGHYGEKRGRRRGRWGGDNTACGLPHGSSRAKIAVGYLYGAKPSYAWGAHMLQIRRGPSGSAFAEVSAGQATKLVKVKPSCN